MRRALAVAALCLAGVAPAAAAPKLTHCATGGVKPSPVRPGLTVTSLTATGVSCAKAARVASTLVKALETGKGVSVTGSAGVSMVESSVNGRTSTSLTLRYRNGDEISVALKGRATAGGGGTTA